ncbi:MAG: DUF3160 domain-containing protein [bacterium]
MLNLLIFSIVLRLSPQLEAKLDSSGFVIVPSSERNIYDIYEHCKKANQPVVVTTDIIFHTTHLAYDYSLRTAEITSLLPKLDTLTLGMLNANLNQLKQAKNEIMKSALSDNVAFFGVAAKLLELEIPDNIPDEVKEKINSELKLIKEHRGIRESPIFGYKEDYTQYVPRGHYTRNYKFENYFKTMMWYGRIGFYLKPHPSMYPDDMLIDPVKEGIKLTRSAILITKTIKASSNLTRLWKEIYKPTISFVGKADDLTIEDYSKLIKDVNIPQDKSILLFIAKANKLASPKIVSIVTESDDSLELKNFRLMGQRFIFDTYAFQNLVYPKVCKYLPNKQKKATDTILPFTAEKTPVGITRCFPRGLDLMSVFGSKTAASIIYNSGDANYENYKEQSVKMKNYFDYLSVPEWKSNLYSQWLYSIRLLLNDKHSNCPSFMLSNEWELKELNSVLGSWAELKHDAILYAKESYTLMTTSMPRTPEFTKGWVEPYPEVYKELSDMITKLSTITDYPTKIKNKLTNYADILTQLSEISEKELTGKPLTKKESDLIWNIGSTLKGMTIFPDEIMKQITSGTDDEMAIIADVHTDPNSRQVLEEAVGYANTIYVRLPASAPDKADESTLMGGVFSYYEFKAPMDGRYTDEKWQQELKSRQVPLQDWFSPLIREY